MKLIMRREDGTEIEVKAINCITEGDIVILADQMLEREYMEYLELYYSHKFNRKVIIVDGFAKKIIAIPPLK